jgi:MOSC domain-containing protein YiiM
VAETGGAPMRSVWEVEAVPGVGLVGDRYGKGVGTYSGNPANFSEVTLVEKEVVEAVRAEQGIPLEPWETRRNLCTSGIRLNELVGKRFRVGEVWLFGERLCEPCRHLERLSHEGLKEALRGRGGLRARILRGGVIRVGAEVEELVFQESELR